MNAQAPRARLMGRSGELSGTTFELGSDTTIGLDEGGKVRVGSGPVSTPLARIFFSDGSYHLENRGKPADVHVDGTPVDGRRTLDRLHVIELSGEFELVFNQAPVARAPDPPPPEGGATAEKEEEPTPPAEAPPRATPSSEPPRPHSDSSPKGELPPDQDPGRTVLDMAGFGSLPQFPDDEPTPAEPSPPGTESPSRETASPEPPPPETESPSRETARPEPGKPPGPSDQDPGRTVLDMAGFGSLPDLEEPTKQEGKGEKQGGKPEDARGATQEAEKEEPIREPPKEPSPASDQDPGRTVLDMAGFGALPDVAGDDPPPDTADRGEKTHPADVEETVEAPSPQVPPSFQLSVDIPGRGPTTFPLVTGDNTVGRGEDCDITVFDPERWLSRKHAVVRIHGEGIELIDLKGVNGTFVGGEKIERVQLTPGSSFSLGPHLKFTLQER